METIDNLQTISELSMALVGFAGIVTAVKSVGQNLSRVQRIQMSVLFGVGMAGIVFSILPQVLFSAHIEEQTIWRYASACYLLLILLALLIRILQLRKSAASVIDFGYAFVALANIQWISLAANLFMGTAWLYMLALSCSLITGLIFFWRSDPARR